MRNLTLALLLVVGVLGGFYSGWKYAQSRGSVAAATQRQGGGGNATTGSRSGSGAGVAGVGGSARGNIAGQIASVGTGTITIHDRTTNADVKVTFDATTPIFKSTPGQVSDLTSGATVTVAGPREADGTVVARSIQLGGGG